MSNTFFVFLGIAAVMGLSWCGIIAKNFVDFTREKPQKLMTGELYPAGRTGTANMGQEVYQANGCASCHTMKVRMNGYGADIQRGWGKRNTALQDYLRDDNVFVGQVRMGPDLADVGSRLPDRDWHLLHLYNPRTTVPRSMMPQYPYLFEKRKVQGEGSANALRLPEKFAPPAGYEIVPTRDAEALVEYLLSLKIETPIFEGPIYPPPATNAPAGDLQNGETPEAAATNQK